MNEKKDNPGIITHPPVFYLIGAALGIGLNKIYDISLMGAEMAQTIAIVIFALSVVIFFMATITFAKNKQNPSVHATPVKIYTKGIYSRSRNPIYLGANMIMISAALYFDNAWLLIMLIPIIYVMTNLVIKKEEIYLENKFGQEYADYKKSVRRWI